MMNKPQVIQLEADLTCQADQMSESLYEALVDQLAPTFDKVSKARKIFVKANLVGYMDSARNRRDLWYKGHPIGSTTPMLAEAVLQLIRRINDTAEIFLGDGLDISDSDTAAKVFERSGLLPLAERYNVRLIDCNEGPYEQIFVPGGGLIHRYLYFRKEVAEADFIINLPKLKVHTTAGVSIGIKNMFGCLPRCFYGGFDRSLFHSSMFKLARILVDVMSVRTPDLTIVDAIVASNKYFIGEPIEMNRLILSDNVVAVDAASTALMGFDPQAEFPSVPFTDMENHLLLASEAGFGPVTFDEMELSADFFDDRRSFSLEHQHYVMKPEEIISWERTVAAGARYYLLHQQQLYSQYAGQWVYIRDDKVLWSVPTIKECSHAVRLEHRKDHFGFCIQVLPVEEQAERIERYLSILNGENDKFSAPREGDQEVKHGG